MHSVKMGHIATELVRFQRESPRNTPVFLNIIIGRLLGLIFLLSVVQWNSVTDFAG